MTQITVVWKEISGGSRIFLRGGTNSKNAGAYLLFCKFLAGNCMKMKEFKPRGRIPVAFLDPPMEMASVYQLLNAKELLYCTVK